MPTYEIELDGKTYEVTADTAAQAASALKPRSSPKPQHDSEERILKAAEDRVLAAEAAEAAQKAREEKHSTMDGVGIGVDKAQQDAYAFLKKAGEVTGSSWISDTADEGLAQQEKDLKDANYEDGDDIGVAGKITETGLQTAAGIGAGTLALVGGAPAIAGATVLGLGALAMNAGKEYHDDPEASLLDVAKGAGAATAIDVMPIPALKAAKIGLPIAGKGAAKVAKAVDTVTDYGVVTKIAKDAGKGMIKGGAEGLKVPGVAKLVETGLSKKQAATFIKQLNKAAKKAPVDNKVINKISDKMGLTLVQATKAKNAVNKMGAEALKKEGMIKGGAKGGVKGAKDSTNKLIDNAMTNKAGGIAKGVGAAYALDAIFGD